MKKPTFITLPRTTNQACALGQFALDFLAGRLGEPAESVFRRTEMFHLDAIACAVSAIACGTNAPDVLRREAIDYRPFHARDGVPLIGSALPVMPEKAVAANCAAVREWDANGTNFGYNPTLGHVAGEFGHNDFYPVAVAAAQLRGLDGRRTLRGMVLLDEIRGRLAEVFPLRRYKIDHVVHGGIASAAVYGAMLGATAAQIESAIGLIVAHYVPFRAIRAGDQLSDSKGASAALAAEMAVVSVRRAMRGFVGPADIFRNPEAIFCLFEKPKRSNESPFDLTLAAGGKDFAVMGMHFKLGLYEHQSAGAIAALLDLLAAEPRLAHDLKQIKRLRVTIYEPAYSIICDPAKRDPRTRQSADHSLPYILARLLRKAELTLETTWQELMLMPDDYSDENLFDPATRRLMKLIELRHGGPEYDAKYPDGIPTRLEIDHAEFGHFDSGLVMYPEGHARNTSGRLESLLEEKFRRLTAPSVANFKGLRTRVSNLAAKSADEIQKLYFFKILRGVTIR